MLLHTAATLYCGPHSAAYSCPQHRQRLWLPPKLETRYGRGQELVWGAGLTSSYYQVRTETLGQKHPSCLSRFQGRKLRTRDFAARSQSPSEKKPETAPKLVEFPRDYAQLIGQVGSQVKEATQAALKDNKMLLEIEFPTGGLDSVPGDTEGGVEMSMSMFLVCEFCRVFALGDQAASTRIFFPDVDEVDSAENNVFWGTSFKFYLTSPSGLEDFGFSRKVRMADRAQPSDKLFVIAYPYFSVNEMLAVEELYRDAALTSCRPIIVFNGELDRIRSGYYPSFFYPKLGALAKRFLPKFETVYYIHNFKGRSGGILFRAYPGPWQVLRKVQDEYVLVHQQPTMPSLKEVALSILPFA